MSNKVVAYDPGHHSGFAVFVDGELVETALFYGLDMPTEWETLLWAIDRHKDAGVMVIEDYVGAGPRTRTNVPVIKLIGALTALARDRGITPVVQGPNRRVPFVKQAKELSLALKSNSYKSRHVHDAAAHGLAYLHSLEKGPKKKV